MDIFILSISMGTLIVLFVSYVINKSETKENEKQQQSYSEEEVLPLLEMLQKCKEYFLLKTDLKSEERADAIGQVLEKFKNK